MTSRFGLRYALSFVWSMGVWKQKTKYSFIKTLIWHLILSPLITKRAMKTNWRHKWDFLRKFLQKNRSQARKQKCTHALDLRKGGRNGGRFGFLGSDRRLEMRLLSGSVLLVSLLFTCTYTSCTVCPVRHLMLVSSLQVMNALHGLIPDRGTEERTKRSYVR